MIPLKSDPHSRWCSVTVILACVLILSGCASAQPDLVLDETPSDMSAMDAAMETSRAAGPSDFQAGDVREINIPGTEVTFTLVYVPGGTYRIGSAEEEAGREGDEGPIQDVVLNGFWMGQFEVSDDEFGVFRNPDRDADTTAVAGAVYRVDAVSRPSPPYEDPAFGMGGAGKPAVGMTQWAGLHYAKWLSEKTGVFFRLPSEAEWEVACRAGEDPAEMPALSGRLLDAAGWYDENSDLLLQEIGQKRPNAWGLHDMLGNAAEWMLDEYVPDYHTRISETPDNPWIEPTRLHPRTVRGGDYGETAAALRCGARLESTTDWKRRDPQIPKSFWWNTDSPFVGFRIMAPETPPSEEDQAFFWTLVLGE